MMNRIRHNYPLLIRCLRVFHILVLAYLLFRCYCYNHYKIPKTLLLLPLLLLPLPPLSYYFATKHFAVDTKFPGVVELTTQLLILENILWLPLWLSLDTPAVDCSRCTFSCKPWAYNTPTVLQDILCYISHGW